MPLVISESPCEVIPGLREVFEVPSGSSPGVCPALVSFDVCSPTVPPMVGGGASSKVSAGCSCASGFGETDLRQRYSEVGKVSLVLGYIKAQRQTILGFSLDPAATSPSSLSQVTRTWPGSDLGKKLFLPSVSFLFQQNALCLPS